MLMWGVGDRSEEPGPPTSAGFLQATEFGEGHDSISNSVVQAAGILAMRPMKQPGKRRSAMPWA